MSTTIRRALMHNIALQAIRMRCANIDAVSLHDFLDYTEVISLCAYDAGTTRDAVWKWLDAPIAGRKRRLINAINKNLRATREGAQ